MQVVEIAYSYVTRPATCDPWPLSGSWGTQQPQIGLKIEKRIEQFRKIHIINTLKDTGIRFIIKKIKVREVEELQKKRDMRLGFKYICLFCSAVLSIGLTGCCCYYIWIRCYWNMYKCIYFVFRWETGQMTFLDNFHVSRSSSLSNLLCIFHTT
jgi:hypothetical protein